MPLGAASVLEPVYDASGEWAKLISVLEVQARFAEDPVSKVDLLHRVARLYEDSLRDHHAAFDVYARALAADNGNEETLGALERLGSTIDRWPQVAQLYDEELDKLAEEPGAPRRSGPAHRADLRDPTRRRRQRGGPLPAGARGRPRKPGRGALARSPLRAHRTLGRSRAGPRARSGDWADARRDPRVQVPPRSGLRARGSTISTRLSPRTARCSRAAPEHAPTLEAIERLFAAGTKQVEIAEILEPLYQAAAEWEKLQRVYEAQLTHLKDPGDRLSMYYRIAELAEEKLLDVPAAMSVYIRAVKEEPLDEKAGQEVERLAGSVDGGWEHLANAYADVLGLHSDPTVQRVVEWHTAHPLHALGNSARITGGSGRRSHRRIV